MKNNRLFVANKPSGISSNHFLSRLKRKYGVKKAGFSGTLDPFANGVLIIAFGAYTKLFNYLEKTPKTYVATLWLGANSQSLDNENIRSVCNLKPFAMDSIDIVMKDLQGKITYVPPKFSAKKIDGKRAYALARNGEEFEMKSSVMEIFNVKLIHYCHPFLSFEISLSEGAYVRSWANLFAKRLGVDGTLSALRRVSEGRFKFENEKALDPLEFLNLAKNSYLGDEDNIKDGKKLDINEFQIKTDGTYYLIFDNFFSIIKIENGAVSYCLNKVECAYTN
ncbi:tRNA pseudouridine(55) synthase TruB [Campylobacter fetus]|uniref:tRNA pseudouridine(55) synthase TruB n=1 Tax=Campylobacter fetus TaxID=196 RepID=UPI000FC9BD40|nr:tRNA pseudouridine(55) synthase TruB [Campylobacter fetus]RUT51095.1 tRNA pseudouridine(55) synthase TruB [Campylobacter fetus]RUT51822.1 tRNA pseudouridine(55) synthase TruB [Campylobacter fetus]